MEMDYKRTLMDSKSMELRDLSSQLYFAADYCKTAFFNSQDKKLIVETTKEYISRAVVTVVDHLGSISANLEYCISESNSVIPDEAQHKIDSLTQRIGTCQQHSHKLGLARFLWTPRFSRYHTRYISLPLKDSTTMSADIARNSESRIDAKSEEANQAEAKELLLSLGTYNCKSSLLESSSTDLPPLNTIRVYRSLIPVHDGLSRLPKAEHSNFQFQEARKQKHGTTKWKLKKQKKGKSINC